MAFQIYKDRVDQGLKDLIEKMGPKSNLRDACEYALFSGGKRLRPILVFLIQEALGSDVDVLNAALSVECFHTASLIADDLPCMDDDATRRGRESLHKAFGESVAILASYALIAEGYGGIYRNSFDPNASLICLETATKCAGLKGATGGQFADLFSKELSWPFFETMIYQKTVTLFEVAFIFGWVFSKGDLNLLDEVKSSAYHLGMAFQLADDLLDEKDDEKSSISVLGKKKTKELFEKETDLFAGSLKSLKMMTPSFERVIKWIKNYPLLKASSALGAPFIFS